MVNIPPIKMVMTGGWFIVVLPTLWEIIVFNGSFFLDTFIDGLFSIAMFVGLLEATRFFNV